MVIYLVRAPWSAIAVSASVCCVFAPLQCLHFVVVKIVSTGMYSAWSLSGARMPKRAHHHSPASCMLPLSEVSADLESASMVPGASMRAPRTARWPCWTCRARC